MVATLGVALFLIAMQIIIGEAKLRAIQPMVGGDGFELGGASVQPQDLMIIVGLAVTGVVLVALLPILVRDSVARHVAGSLRGAHRGDQHESDGDAHVGPRGALRSPRRPPVLAPRRVHARVHDNDPLDPRLHSGRAWRVTSLPGAVVGGFAIGLIESFFGYFLGEQVRGADGLGVFIALLAVLIVRPRGLLGKEA